LQQRSYSETFHQKALLVGFKSGFLNLWATEEFSLGHGLVVMKLKAFYKLIVQVIFNLFCTATHYSNPL